eukprot:TRINITY_DN22394_c0_g1_i1.p1 TRINITY_DN22394_c0_g1~~TRINITY_DN22394_c0_g1_i1.p1  ORF type:complete len:435 (-),score=134.18 TRINITY_DN22394_c0_g1_i1:105-1409(-)
MSTIWAALDEDFQEEQERGWDKVEEKGDYVVKSTQYHVEVVGPELSQVIRLSWNVMKLMDVYNNGKRIEIPDEELAEHPIGNFFAEKTENGEWKCVSNRGGDIEEPEDKLEKMEVPTETYKAVHYTDDEKQECKEEGDPWFSWVSYGMHMQVNEQEKLAMFYPLTCVWMLQDEENGEDGGVIANMNLGNEFGHSLHFKCMENLSNLALLNQQEGPQYTRFFWALEKAMEEFQPDMVHMKASQKANHAHFLYRKENVAVGSDIANKVLSKLNVDSPLGLNDCYKQWKSACPLDSQFTACVSSVLGYVEIDRDELDIDALTELYPQCVEACEADVGKKVFLRPPDWKKIHTVSHERMPNNQELLDMWLALKKPKSYYGNKKEDDDLAGGWRNKKGGAGKWKRGKGKWRQNSPSPRRNTPRSAKTPRTPSAGESWRE